MLLATVLMPQYAMGGELRVLALLGENTPPYAAFGQALRQNLPASIRLEMREVGSVGSEPHENFDLLIAVGIRASEVAVSNARGAVLSVMVSKGAYENLFSGGRTRSGMAAIYLDQPWARQIGFLYALFPDLERIGVLYSPETRFEIAPLLDQVAQRGGAVVAQSVRSSDNLFSSLEKVLSGCDVLLAIPDSHIYHSGSIRNILLSSYRKDIPLIGFSQGYVNAGALGAIYSTPEQQAEQAAKQVLVFAQKRGLDSSQYPDNYSIALNIQVARSMSIRLPGEAEIRKRISMLEGKR